MNEHQAMLRALRDKDRAGLVALCRKHLEPARDAYLDHLDLGDTD
jgi:DNA-binding GntR family transcriptional regulator